MRKFLFLLCTLLGTARAWADVITSASQLSNTKVYTIRTTRGYMTLNTAQTMIVSTHSSNGGTVNSNAATDDASKQFGILNIDGKYFIYSPKLNKFACLQGQNLYMYTDRGVALDITTDGQGNPDGSKLRFFAYKIGSEGYSKWCLNNNNAGNLVLNSYTGAEAGNTVSIEEVAGVTLDTDAAMAVFNGAPHFYDLHKVYNITNARLTQWTANADNTGLTGITGNNNNNAGATAAQQQFAFFKYNDKQYLYNVGAKKFVATDGSLTPNKGDAATIGVWYTGNSTYPYCFYIEDRGLLFNGQGSGGFAINAWNSGLDDGNQHNLVEVAGVDVYDEILEFFEIPSWDVTYNIYYKGEKIGEEVRTQDKGSDVALSSAWDNDFVTFTYSATTITDGVTSVDATITWTGPTLYSNYESIEWKNLYVDRNYEGADGSKCYLANTANPPTYVKNPTDKQRASDAFQWGFVGNPYQVKVYNKLAGPTQTLHPNNTIEMADGDSYWSIKISCNGGFMIGKTGNVNSFINQSGGYNGTNMGYWGSTTDFGNAFKQDDVPEIPLTNVYYDITFNGVVAHTIAAAGLEVGDDVPEMPTVTLPDYTTITAPDVTGMTVTEDMHITVPATWSGPFDLATDYASAHWYDMAIRETWYVTSDNKDGDDALLTVNANALGLGEDAYHWAFVGDPWHIQVFNKAEGATKNFGYPTQANQGVPSFQTDTYYWTIKPSTSGIANSFVMGVPNTNLYINQFGGAGGSLKFWNSTNNISDIGSAFTVFDIPDDFAEFAVAEIQPYATTTGYFALKDAVKSTIGWQDSYATTCPFETYKSMKLALAAINMTDLDNYVLPETGYYTLKNKYYGKYMGIDPSDANMYGNYETATAAKQIVKLTKNADNTYTIGLMGKYAPASVSQSAQVTASTTAGTYTVVIPVVGYAAFKADPSSNMSCLHCAGGGSIVGWEAPAAASQWEVEDAESIQFTISDKGDGWATAYLPFPYTTPEGVTVYTGTVNGSALTLTEIEGTIPASTPVVLKAAAAGDYTFTIAEEADAITDNALSGSYDPVTGGEGIYALAKKDNVVGFYPVASTVTIPVGKAYLNYSAGVKGFTFVFEDNATGIENLNVNANLNGAIYNVAGQRLNKVQKGINIVNGKKILK